MPPFIGIDLGTIFTVAASADPAGRASVIRSPSGRRKTPSVVTFGGNVPAVGRHRPAAGGGTVVECVKAMLGDPTRRLPLPPAAFVRPEEVTALLLARMRAQAEWAFGADITQAVLTVPASFDFAARRALRNAGRIAGLQVCQMLNEPTAAVLAYLATLPRECTVLVFGLGGGVFDASVLHVERGRVEVHATAGDRRLGGWDWDNLLMLVLQDRLTALGGPDLLAGEGTEATLRGHARAAKHRLSSLLRTEVVLRHGDAAWRIPISRGDFEAATRRLLGRSRILVERVLSSGRVTSAEIDRVLLVGGPTRMPAVRRMLRPLLGQPLDCSVAPAEAVALGAASYGPALGVRDVASHGLGLMARNPHSGRLQNITIVPAGSALPATNTAVLTTGQDEPGRFLLDITMSDAADPDTVRTVHRETVDLQLAPGTPVEVRCGYDAEEVPQVEVRANTGRIVHAFAVHDPGAMPEPELTAAAERMAGLPARALLLAR